MTVKNNETGSQNHKEAYIIGPDNLSKESKGQEERKTGKTVNEQLETKLAVKDLSVGINKKTEK